MYRKLLNKLMTKTGLFFTVFIIQIVTIPMYHLPTIADALNPLALGFMARGDDWSQYLIADGYYYKYGQLIFYFPLIYLIRNNVILYRAMLTVNALIVSCIPVCVYEILTRHLRSTDKKINYYISLLTATIPVISLNSECTWAEPVLMVLPWIILLLLLKSMEGEGSKKRKYFYSVAIATVQVYAYMVHTRGIVLFMATLICVCLIKIFYQNKNIKLHIYFTTTLVLLILDKMLGTAFKEILYGDTKELTGGTLGFLNGEFLNNFFSFNGFKIWGEEITGWLFASVASTFGLVSLGLVVSFAILFQFREWKENRQELVIIIFSVLCFLGALILGTVFFLDNLLAADGIEIAKRGDKLVYARYLNGANVCISFIGLYYIMLKRKLWKATLFSYSIIIYIVLHGFFLSLIAERIDHTITWTHITVTINYFCDLASCVRGGLYSTVNAFSGGIAIFSLAAFLIFCIALLNKKRKTIFFVLYLAVFLMGYAWSSYNVLYRADTYMMQVIEEYEDVIKCVQGEKELTNLYLDDEILRCGFQYFFSDYYILTKRDENKYDIQNMFILSSNERYNRDLFENDYYEILNVNREASGYHLYIKGSSLNEKLQEKGYITREIIEM